MFDCQACSKSYKRRDILKTHIEFVHQKIKRHKCEACPQEFYYKSKLKLHIDTVHLDIPLPKRLQKRVPIKLECKLCGAHFGGYRTFKNHTRKVHEEQDILDYSCVLCSKKFEYKYSLQKHMKTKHDESRPFNCHLCSKTYNLNYVLLDHLRKVHLKDQEAICQVCNKIFESSERLRLHNLRSHSNLSFLSCNRCPEKFTTRFDLGHHTRKHRKLDELEKKSKSRTTPKVGGIEEREIWHKCSFCDQSFRHQFALNRHLKKDHDEERSF